MSASHRKSTQVHAKAGQTESQVDQVFNMRLLATPFGQGLTMLAFFEDDHQIKGHFLYLLNVPKRPVRLPSLCLGVCLLCTCLSTHFSAVHSVVKSFEIACK